MSKFQSLVSTRAPGGKGYPFKVSYDFDNQINQFHFSLDCYRAAIELAP